MTATTPDEHREAFLASRRPHVLMITNHGIHQWQVVPGLPDTGGQNIFVNQLTDALADLGFRITIANRGGYVHPTSGEQHVGVRYRDGVRRILYLEDDVKAFVRKEDMDANTPQLAAFLADRLAEDGLPIELIVSHYWDAAKIGLLLNQQRAEPARHIWVPHSLGAVKKENMSPSTWAGLRIDERIAVEKSLLPELDGVAATSSRIRESLRDDYGYDTDLLLPPCVDTDRFHARSVPADHAVWRLLAELTGLSGDEVRRRRIVTEISRTDRTKRKDVLLRAFAKVLGEVPEALLVVAIDDTEAELAAELRGLIDELGLTGHVAAVGNVWELLPELYSVTSVYCSPSVMEGFGMAVQEAAATAVPVVGSHLIPFAVEYLLGDEATAVHGRERPGSPLRWGEGAAVVEADDVAGFAAALVRLLADEDLRSAMGRRAYEITVPRFTWRGMTIRFLAGIGAEVPQ